MAEFLDIFVLPPGNLLYFIAVIAISQIALFIALEQRRRNPKTEQAAGRYTLASLGILGGWVMLGAGALAGPLTGQSVSAILPPIEPVVNVIVLLFAGWALLCAENTPRSRLWDIALLALLTLAVTGGALTLRYWLSTTDMVVFNATWSAAAWMLAGLILTALMLIAAILRLRVTPNAPLKALFFIIILAGYGILLTQAASGSLGGDYAGVLRGAYLIGMTLYGAAVYRHVIARLSQQAVHPTAAPARPRQAPPRAAPSTTLVERESVQLLRALGDMLATTRPEAIPAQIVTATANVLKADVVALGRTRGASWVEIVAVYDSVRQKSLQGMDLNLNDQPTLARAIASARQETLRPDQQATELVDLFTRLDVSGSGPLGNAYFQPLRVEGETRAVLIVLFPFTGRELRTGEAALLEGLAPMASKLLALSEQAVAAPPTPLPVAPGEPSGEIDLSEAIRARQAMQQSLEMAYAQIQQLSTAVADLKNQLERERRRLAEVLASDEETLSISQQIRSLSQESVALEAERNRLASELQEARTTLAGATARGNDDLYRSLIDMLSQEQKTLEEQKANLEHQLAVLREQTSDMFLVPASIQQTLESLYTDKARLTEERDRIAAELEDVQTELSLLGVEGGVAGLALMIGQLHEERDALRAQLAALSESQADPAAAGARIEALESELARLAADREAAVKQRDALRQEQAAWQQEREEWQAQRQRLGQQISAIQQQINTINAQRDQIIQERNALAAERARLQEERDRLLAERTALLAERDQLLARMQGSLETAGQLGAEGIDTLKSMIDDLTAERTALEQRLLQAQSELHSLEGKLRAYEHSAAAAADQAAPAVLRPEQPEVVLSLAQELRTPMSSITGYIDLLLGESVGILGASQRKFLQRIKANLERMGSLIEDLLRVIVLDTGQISLEPKPVDLIALLDDAITEISSRFREKGITLDLDIPDEIPAVHVDRDAMQQVLNHLLINAYLASPTDGEVRIIARTQPLTYTDAGQVPVERDSVILAIEDQGGGIPPQDRARVFSRLHRADNPLIQGVGDTGVGLSIARALVEAHKGRIWVESEVGIGSRFAFAIPCAPATEQW